MGVPYEVKDLLSLIPYQTDYTMKLGPNLGEFRVHFPCLGRVDPQGVLDYHCCNLEYESSYSIHNNCSYYREINLLYTYFMLS